MFFIIFIFFLNIFSSDDAFRNKFYYLSKLSKSKAFYSECFALRDDDFHLYQSFKEENKTLKHLPFFKDPDVLEKFLNKRAKEHFYFFVDKNIYPFFYRYFSLDTGIPMLNQEKLLVWQCFFDYKKENNFLLDTFVFDEKNRNEKKNFYDKSLRSTLLGKEFLEFSEDVYPGSLSYLDDTGNCDGLALYSFLDCLYRKKIFDGSHIITLGSIEKNGDVGMVGEAFNKFFYWLIYLQYKVNNNALNSNEFLFLISNEYSSFIFGKMFLFFEKKFNTKINRFYIKNIKDLESSCFRSKVNNDTEKENFINKKTEEKLFFDEKFMQEYLDVLNLKLFDIYDFCANCFKSHSEAIVSKFLTFSSEKKEFFGFIDSLFKNRFLSVEEKRKIIKLFSRKEVENVCSFFSGGQSCINFFYGDE